MVDLIMGASYIRVLLAVLVASAPRCAAKYPLECLPLTPKVSAQATYSDIMWCLKSKKSVELLGRDYFVSQGISMPPGSSLRGSGSAVSRIVIVTPSSLTDFVLRTANETSVRDVTLDAGNRLPGGCCTSVIAVFGHGSRLQDVVATDSPNGVGLNILDAASKDNHFLRVEVRSCYYGVVFPHGLTKGHRNIFEAGTIEGIACDAVTFAGYGELIGSTIRDSGFGCVVDGARVPGAAAVCLGNTAGGAIVGNSMRDTCGAIFQADSCRDVVLAFNDMRDPGNTWGGQYPHCTGASTVSLLDCRDHRVEGNTVINTRGSNARGRSPFGDPHFVLSDNGNATFSDLPLGHLTILNFVIAQRPEPGTVKSVGHQILGNRFVALCPPDVEDACEAVGFFAGRGTGEAVTEAPPAEAEVLQQAFARPLRVAESGKSTGTLDAAAAACAATLRWRDVCGHGPANSMLLGRASGERQLAANKSEAHTGHCWTIFECGAGIAEEETEVPRPLGTSGTHRRSLYAGNRALESSYPTRRCGFNAYASSRANCPRGSPPPCNDDDFKHVWDNFRNDRGCSGYLPATRSPRPAEVVGRWRGPLPYRASSLSAVRLQDGDEVEHAWRYQELVLAGRPVAYWRLGAESLGSNLGVAGFVADASFVGGAAPAAVGLLEGDTDMAALFDGSPGQAVRVPDSKAINLAPQEARTVELWFEAADIGADLTLFEEGGVSRGLNVHVTMKDDRVWVVVGAWCYHATSTWGPFFLAAEISVGVAYHVALVLDGNPDGDTATNDGTLAGFLNGARFDVAVGVGVLWEHPGDVAIGGDAGGTRFRGGVKSKGAGESFNGTIDEVVVYNDALSPLALHSHYVVGRGLDVPACDTAAFPQPPCDASREWCCQRHGDCWSSIDGARPCPLASRTCALEDAARSSCGHSDIDQAQCRRLGCCWSPIMPNPHNYPSCFYQAGTCVGVCSDVRDMEKIGTYCRGAVCTRSECCSDIGACVRGSCNASRYV